MILAITLVIVENLRGICRMGMPSFFIVKYVEETKKENILEKGKNKICQNV